MKAALPGNQINKERGSSILEVLIAISVLTLGVAASTLLSFANQSMQTDSNTSDEALYKTKGILENARASSTIDFDGIVSTATTSESVYFKKFDVTDLTPCRKEAISRITWSTEKSRPQKIELKTNFTDVAEALALGGDCASDPPIGGWSNPGTLTSRDLDYHAAFGDNPSVNSSNGNQATDVDALHKTVYMTAGVSTPASKDDFFVLDATNILSGTIPPIQGSLHTGPGLNALDIAYDTITGKTFAYAVQNDNQKQFQVIDVSNPANPVSVASTTLPNITFTCSPVSSPCLAGTAVYYNDGKVYIGTAYIANLALPNTKNNEFHVYCVAPDSLLPVCSGSSPANPIWLGSFNVNHNVNSIAVRGSYAYIATSDDAGELTVLDISNPASIPNPAVTGTKFDAPGSEDGASVYRIGNMIYLGRERTPAGRKDFYVLDIANPLAITEVGSKNLGLNSSAEVSDIRISGKNAFLGVIDPNDGFQVLDISNPANISRISSFNYSQKTTGVDFEDGFIYTSNESNDALRIIKPAQCADKIDNDGDSKIDIADSECHTDGNANNSASYNPEDTNES